MKKTVAVCTLFEGSYDLGVAALINSFKFNGFTGALYVGYRGTLPKWIQKSDFSADWSWDGMTIMEIDSQFKIYFLPLTTNYHFTNYKPDFMLELWNGPAKNAQEIYYLDPDIILASQWKVFSEWVESGIALCEDINSPMSENHPKRIKWREYFINYGLNLKYKTDAYVNGGFIGLKREDMKFLEIWKKIQESMADRIGGLSKSSLKGEAMDESEKTLFSPFGKTDQDALNAAVEAYPGRLSILGRSTMGFESTQGILPHALGQPKPWDKNYLMDAFKGFPPKQVDKEYWNYVDNPIKVFSTFKILRKKTTIRIAILISRFYRRQ